jgi:predicted ATP-dependent endonuclease of OLD family
MDNLISVQLFDNENYLIGNVSFELKPKVTVISGGNGSGKTTLLEAIRNKYIFGKGYEFSSFYVGNYFGDGKYDDDTEVSDRITNYHNLLEHTAKSEDIKTTLNTLEKLLNDFFEESKKVKVFDNGSIEFRYKESNRLVDIKYLSRGEKKLLLMFLIVSVTPDKDAVLLYNKPEQDLHFDWQKNLFDAILKLNPNAKLLVTTHSPALIVNAWLDTVIEMSDLLKSKS